MQLVTDIIQAAFLVGMLVAFAVLFLGRFEVRGASLRNWVVMRAPALVSEAFSCDFCLCWWFSLAGCAVLSLVVGWWVLLAAPVATPIARIFAS